MPNPWVEFVRKWSLENNERYACSVGNPKCREEYYVIKEGKKTALKLEKEKEKEKERIKRIEEAQTKRRHSGLEKDKAKKEEERLKEEKRVAEFRKNLEIEEAEKLKESTKYVMNLLTENLINAKSRKQQMTAIKELERVGLKEEDIKNIIKNENAKRINQNKENAIENKKRKELINKFRAEQSTLRQLKGDELNKSLKKFGLPEQRGDFINRISVYSM